MLGEFYAGCCILESRLILIMEIGTENFLGVVDSGTAVVADVSVMINKNRMLNFIKNL